MKLYSILVTSIFIFGFLIIGYASSSDTNENYHNNKLEQVAVNNLKEKLSEEEAANLVKEYLKSKSSYIPNHIEVDSTSGNTYLVHAYDVITNEEESHIATSGWFEVNMYTGDIVDIMNE